MHNVFRGCLALIVAFLSLTAARASDLFALEWRKLDDGVWVGQRPDAMRYPVVCNTVIVEGEDSVLIFDGGGFPSQGEQVLAKVKALTAKPVKYIVVSHWHGDHNRGIEPIVSAYPGVEVIAQTFTRDAITGAPMQKIMKSELAGSVRDTGAAVKKALADNKFIDGSPLAPAEHAFWERFVADYPVHDAEIARMKITVPTKTFEDELDLHLGRRLVQLRHLGPGNTKGDAFMVLPAEHIIAAGDIVVEPIPYAFGSYPQSWAKVLREIKAIGYKTLIPGHGALQTDTTYIDLMAEVLDSVAAQVNAGVAQGKTLDDIRKNVDLTRFEQRFAKDDAVLKRFFGFYFKGPAIIAAYNVAKGIENEKLTDDDAPKKPN
jgi:glyoxylase-like metal-dependent hydrolase (beta-lactamase superfamily II)